MSTFDVITLSTSQASLMWDDLIKSSCNYDFYHLSDYHRIAEMRGEGQALLLAFTHGQYRIFLPLLVRPVSTVAGLEGFEYRDVTSVYGYAGPVYSHQDLPTSVIKDFQETTRRFLTENKIIAVFSRLHPLILQKHIIEGLGLVLDVGVTVSIDLTIPLECQRKKYRKNHKSGINRSRRLGWKVMGCRNLGCGNLLFEQFVAVYWETMDRLGAARYYYFDRDYFADLLQLKGAEVWIFAVHLNGEVGATGIFTLCNGIVQYHLGGSKTRFLREAPMKLLFDEVRLWASERGARIFHLGGGVGGKMDSLFHFKAGFSDCRHTFSVWKWIVDYEAYEELCSKREQRNCKEDEKVRNRDFFPKYRIPYEV